MHRFATNFALLTIALFAAACDPSQAIRDALPGGCSPAADIWTSPPTTTGGPHQMGITSQYESTRPAPVPKSGNDH